VGCRWVVGGLWVGCWCVVGKFVCGWWVVHGLFMGFGGVVGSTNNLKK